MDLKKDHLVNFLEGAKYGPNHTWPIHSAIKKVNGHPRIIIGTNLVDIVSPMLYTKIKLQSFLCTGEENLSMCF